MMPGRVLSTNGKLGARRMQLAREAQAADGRLSRVAAELGFDGEEDALQAVGEAMGLEFVDLSETDVDLSLLQEFPIKLIHRHGVFPIRLEEGSLVVATGNPFELHALDAVGATTGRSVLPVLALPEELAGLIKTHLGGGAETIDGLLTQDAQHPDDFEVL